MVALRAGLSDELWVVYLVELLVVSTGRLMADWLVVNWVDLLASNSVANSADC